MTSPWLFCLAKSRKHITTSKRPEDGLFLTFSHLGVDGDGDGDGEVILMRILLLVFINVTLGGGIVVQGFGDLMRACVT